MLFCLARVQFPGNLYQFIETLFGFFGQPVSLNAVSVK